MSQHHFRTLHQGSAITVMLGWDRPIGHFFMVIERDAPGKEGDEDGYLYSNLNESEPFSLTIDDYRRKLAELGIEVPAPMFEQVEMDRAMRIGNCEVWHHADGTFVRRGDAEGEHHGND